MNIKVKKTISVIAFIATVIGSLSFSAFAEKGRVIKNINDDMAYISSGGGVIKIDSASLYENNRYLYDVYVIGLSGSDLSLDVTHTSALINCYLSAFSLPSPYLKELKNQAKKHIPENSKIILIGHSLGGAIAQQFSANSEMKKRYEILNTVCIGAPYITVIKREGKICRISDSGDAVPYLSPALFVNAFIGNYIYEDTGYFGKPNKAHNVSYRVSEKWGRYDCLGNKNGGYSLKLH